MNIMRHSIWSSVNTEQTHIKLNYWFNKCPVKLFALEQYQIDVRIVTIGLPYFYPTTLTGYHCIEW